MMVKEWLTALLLGENHWLFQWSARRFDRYWSWYKKDPALEWERGGPTAPSGKDGVSWINSAYLTRAGKCVCHIVWIPQYRRDVLCGEARREIGQIPREAD